MQLTAIQATLKLLLMSYGSLLTIAKAYLDTIQVTNGSRICIVLDNDTSFDYLSKFYLNLN